MHPEDEPPLHDVDSRVQRFIKQKKQIDKYYKQLYKVASPPTSEVGISTDNTINPQPYVLMNTSGTQTQSDFAESSAPKFQHLQHLDRAFFLNQFAIHAAQSDNNLLSARDHICKDIRKHLDHVSSVNKAAIDGNNESILTVQNAVGALHQVPENLLSILNSAQHVDDNVSRQINIINDLPSNWSSLKENQGQIIEKGNAVHDFCKIIHNSVSELSQKLSTALENQQVMMSQSALESGSLIPTGAVGPSMWQACRDFTPSPNRRVTFEDLEEMQKKFGISNTSTPSKAANLDISGDIDREEILPPIIEEDSLQQSSGVEKMDESKVTEAEKYPSSPAEQDEYSYHEEHLLAEQAGDEEISTASEEEEAILSSKPTTDKIAVIKIRRLDEDTDDKKKDPTYHPKHFI